MGEFAKIQSDRVAQTFQTWPSKDSVTPLLLLARSNRLGRIFQGSTIWSGAEPAWRTDWLYTCHCRYTQRYIVWLCRLRIPGVNIRVCLRRLFEPHHSYRICHQRSPTTGYYKEATDSAFEFWISQFQMTALNSLGIKPRVLEMEVERE